MSMGLRSLLISVVLALVSLTGHAEGTLFKVPTRSDVKTTLFWEPVEGAKATVFLFPGGGGGFGKVEDGKPTSNNFLVRSAPYFTANGSTWRFLAGRAIRKTWTTPTVSATPTWPTCARCWTS